MCCYRKHDDFLWTSSFRRCHDDSGGLNREKGGGKEKYFPKATFYPTSMKFWFPRSRGTTTFCWRYENNFLLAKNKTNGWSCFFFVFISQKSQSCSIKLETDFHSYCLCRKIFPQISHEKRLQCDFLTNKRCNNSRSCNIYFNYTSKFKHSWQLWRFRLNINHEMTKSLSLERQKSELEGSSS